MPKHRSFSKFLSLFVVLFAQFIFFGVTPSQADQYEVVPRGSSLRASFWLSDGPADVISSNTSAGNRFRLGGEIHLGEDYQFILGLTFADWIYSGETSPTVGTVDRVGTDFNFGYFLVPDRFWLMYSFQLGEVNGGNVHGWAGTYGQQLSAGYRFYSSQNINLALELAYLYIPGVTAQTYDFESGNTGLATYPQASVISLNLRVAFDIGGRTNY